eukprot:Ihof_evm2s142 gene=Ihof_evmTU2s142
MLRWLGLAVATATLISAVQSNPLDNVNDGYTLSKSSRRMQKRQAPLNIRSLAGTEHDFVQQRNVRELTGYRARRADDPVGNKTKTDDAEVQGNSFVLGKMRSKYVTIEWVGAEKATQAILVVNNMDDTLNAKTQLWRSEDNGVNFVDESSKINNLAVDSNSLMKNPNFENHVLLISKDKKKIFVSVDSGKEWESHPFNLDLTSDMMSFHPTLPNLLLGVGSKHQEVYYSKDYGRTWIDTKIKNVFTLLWASPDAKDAKLTCYWTMKREGYNRRFDLYRTTDLFETHKMIKQDGFDLAIINEYIFMSSLMPDQHTMSLQISEDGGNVWNYAHFPANLSKTNIDEQKDKELGYQILDVSEGSVFVNVDNDDGTNPHNYHTGNLYVSDMSGTVYALSLRNHLFIENVRSDFHMVASIVGTYITNQLVMDNRIQEFRTVISFDKGGEWKPLRAPERDWNGTKWKCSDCYLQLHNFVSEETTHLIQPIFSQEAAVGLVIAHGSVGRYLEVSNTSLFVSRDGGYRWKAALPGTWSFAVADRGGIIMAAEVGKGRQNSIKYSWDFGNTWKTFVFQKEAITIVKVLSKPGTNTRTFNVWGNTADGLWTIVTISFRDLFSRPCTEDAFESWSPTDGRVSNQRCVLGYKKSYLRRKHDHLCFTNQKADFNTTLSEEPCPCTREDFECDYGFVRPNIDAHCVEYNSYNKTGPHPCDGGAESYKESSGYRKVPGDKCIGGVVDQYIVGRTVMCPKPKKTSIFAVIIPILAVVLAMASIAIVMFIYNRKKNYWRARYMALAQIDHDDYIPHTGLD